VAKSRRLGIQSVNRVFALTLTVENEGGEGANPRHPPAILFNVPVSRDSN
jgi:hypothetical protein